MLPCSNIRSLIITLKERTKYRRDSISTLVYLAAACHTIYGTTSHGGFENHSLRRYKSFVVHVASLVHSPSSVLAIYSGDKFYISVMTLYYSCEQPNPNTLENKKGLACLYINLAEAILWAVHSHH